MLSADVRFWNSPLLLPREWRSEKNGRRSKDRDYVIEKPEDLPHLKLGTVVRILRVNGSVSGATKLRGKIGIVWKTKDYLEYPDVICFKDEALPLTVMEVTEITEPISNVQQLRLEEIIRSI